MPECKKCGTCCRWVYVTFPWDIHLRELDKLRGIEQVSKDTIRAPVYCKLYDSETCLCKDYEHRPVECQIWPANNEKYIPKECKYHKQEEET
jgi:uncharacterized cysteine cluster protein YcgN (CxxCxxCC family)